IKPGWGQIGDVLVVTTATCGVGFAMFGRCFENWQADVPARVLFAVVSLATLFHPNDKLIWGTAAVTLVALIWAIRRHNVIAPPKDAPAPEIDATAPAPPEDLARVVAEARRDIG
ncbi:MAG TPA: hypothetical protein VI730_01585, partial [Burkholderiales bacterium]|nr:hypothetical protein [Burkholderiales bacterium]